MFFKQISNRYNKLLIVGVFYTGIQRRIDDYLDLNFGLDTSKGTLLRQVIENDVLEETEKLREKMSEPKMPEKTFREAWEIAISL
jgi:hypothetical protein